MLEGARAEERGEKEEQTVEEEKVVEDFRVLRRNESTGTREYKNPAFYRIKVTTYTKNALLRCFT